MKAALEELIDMLIEARSVSIESEDIEQTYTNAIRLALSMLEKEKGQIENAYIDGLGEQPVPFFSNFQAEQYYNEIYNTKDV